jgi:hypothetical protein
MGTVAYALHQPRLPSCATARQDAGVDEAVDGQVSPQVFAPRVDCLRWGPAACPRARGVLPSSSTVTLGWWSCQTDAREGATHGADAWRQRSSRVQVSGSARDELGPLSHPASLVPSIPGSRGAHARAPTPYRAIPGERAGVQGPRRDRDRLATAEKRDGTGVAGSPARGNRSREAEWQAIHNSAASSSVNRTLTPCQHASHA